MPTPANAFDFEDNPSGSDDELLRIPRRVNTRNTVDSILEDTMTGEIMADKDARMKRGSAYNKSKTKRANASGHKAPNSEDEIKQQSSSPKQKQEREARHQTMEDAS